MQVLELYWSVHSEHLNLILDHETRIASQINELVI